MNIIDLWLPISLAGVANHVLNTMFWMVLPHHKPEWKKLPDEDEFIDIVSFSEIPPGQYVFPMTRDSAEMRNPVFLAKQRRCNGMLIIWKKPLNMLGTICGTLAVFVVIAFVIGYLATLSSLHRDSTFMEIFQFIFTAGLLAHCAAKFPFVLWFRRRIAMELFDGVCYAAATAAIFAALWGFPPPR